MTDYIESNKWKIISTFLLTVSFFSIAITGYFLSNVCLEIGDCSNYSRRGFLLPLQTASIYLLVLMIVFTLLPQSYFKHYAKVWLWWMVLVSFLIAIAAEPVGSSIISFDRSEVVNFLGIINVVVAAFVILKIRKNKK